ncbi:hypothetical protein JCM8547_006010 [Rhodosporidiobolus lusitaniae]
MKPRRGSFDASEEDAIALRQVDELLDEDRRLSLSSNTSNFSTSPRRRSSLPYALPSQGGSKRLLVSLVATVGLSAVSSRQLARLDRHSNLATLAFPLSHFGTLAVVAYALGWLRPRGVLGISAGGGQGAGDAAGRKIAWGAGAASALALVLRLWEVRMGDHRLAEALEVFTIPTLLALLPYATSKLTYSSTPHAQPGMGFVTAAAVVTFLVGFALIGTPANGAGLALGLLRLPLEAIVLVLIKEGLTAEEQSASLVSLLSLPISLLLPAEEAPRTLDPTAYASLSATLLLTVLSQIALLCAIHFSTSTSTPASTLFPRNLILLVWATRGREGIPLRENWMQIALVYGVGSIALLWTDSEVVEAVKSLRSGGEGSNYLPVGNGQAGSPSLNIPSPPPHIRKSSDHHVLHAPANSSRPSLLSLVPFLPLLVYLITTPATTSSLSSACTYLPPSLRSTVCPTSSSPKSRTVDLVVSYYDEDLARTKQHINHIRLETEFVKPRSSRVVVYNKGPRSEKQIREGLMLKRADEVVELPNLGREGATYLKHIMLHYNSTLSALSPSYRPESSPSLASATAQLRTKTLADHTYFLQPHLAWDFVALPRLELIGPDTGFAHLGPYIQSKCGRDENVNIDFPVAKEIFSMFAQQVCPPTGQTMAWSGQFVVSKRRILANPYARYAAVDEIIEAPKGHWVHDMWGPNESGGPSNPAVGHSIERAWPSIFACWDRRLADECTNDVADKEKCQCLDC